MSQFSFYFGSGRTLSTCGYLFGTNEVFARRFIDLALCENPIIPLVGSNRALSVQGHIDANHIFGIRYKRLVAYRGSSLAKNALVMNVRVSPDDFFPTCELCEACIKSEISEISTKLSSRYKMVNGKVLMWLSGDEEFLHFPFPHCGSGWCGTPILRPKVYTCLQHTDWELVPFSFAQ